MKKVNKRERKISESELFPKSVKGVLAFSLSLNLLSLEAAKKNPYSTTNPLYRLEQIKNWGMPTPGYEPEEEKTSEKPKEKSKIQPKKTPLTKEQIAKAKDKLKNADKNKSTKVVKDQPKSTIIKSEIKKQVATQKVTPKVSVEVVKKRPSSNEELVSLKGQVDYHYYPWKYDPNLKSQTLILRNIVTGQEEIIRLNKSLEFEAEVVPGAYELTTISSMGEVLSFIIPQLNEDQENVIVDFYSTSVSEYLKSRMIDLRREILDSNKVSRLLGQSESYFSLSEKVRSNNIPTLEEVNQYVKNNSRSTVNKALRSSQVDFRRDTTRDKLFHLRGEVSYEFDPRKYNSNALEQTLILRNLKTGKEEVLRLNDNLSFDVQIPKGSYELRTISSFGEVLTYLIPKFESHKNNVQVSFHSTVASEFVKFHLNGLKLDLSEGGEEINKLNQAALKYQDFCEILRQKNIPEEIQVIGTKRNNHFDKGNEFSAENYYKHLDHVDHAEVINEPEEKSNPVPWWQKAQVYKKDKETVSDELIAKLEKENIFGESKENKTVFGSWNENKDLISKSRRPKKKEQTNVMDKVEIKKEELSSQTNEAKELVNPKEISETKAIVQLEQKETNAEKKSKSVEPKKVFKRFLAFFKPKQKKEIQPVIAIDVNKQEVKKEVLTAKSSAVNQVNIKESQAVVTKPVKEEKKIFKGFTQLKNLFKRKTTSDAKKSQDRKINAIEKNTDKEFELSKINKLFIAEDIVKAPLKEENKILTVKSSDENSNDKNEKVVLPTVELNETKRIKVEPKETKQIKVEPKETKQIEVAKVKVEPKQEVVEVTHSVIKDKNVDQNQNSKGIQSRISNIVNGAPYFNTLASKRNGRAILYVVSNQDKKANRFNFRNNSRRFRSHFGSR